MADVFRGRMNRDVGSNSASRSWVPQDNQLVFECVHVCFSLLKRQLKGELCVSPTSMVEVE